MIEPNLPEQLQRWQPQIRYLLLDEHRYTEADLAGQRNLAAALFRLENSRQPEDIERVLASLIDWLTAPEQDELRRAFVVWLKRVLLPARVPGAELPPVNDLQEMHAMLAERVKTWTEEWKQQGLDQGRLQGRLEGRLEGEAKVVRRLLIRRFGALPAWVDQRLERASEVELDVWTERLLDGQTLEAVFNDMN
ncbi:DUF4351 domain-containing protein [Thiocystis violacea]|uniref:DUF4351 domain-containing protein n=1 Tax=Thiocystis violacea TaxID=13725 RepID=UPI001F5BAAB7|nr:DUF4351 domain-containing protein [Thiocystis violacea]